MGFSPSSSSCSFRLSLISFSLFLLMVFGFLSSIPSPTFLTFSALILSTVAIFTSTKKKEIPEANSSKAAVVLTDDVLKTRPEMEVDLKIQLENDAGQPEKETQESSDVGQIHDSVVGSVPEPLLDSRCDLSSTTEDSNVDHWSYYQTPECSDCSVSDDESLIEITLPEGRYIGPKGESEGSFQPCIPEILPEYCLFNQHGLMEFLSEINDINEEDNLIEIDISVGSIKCSRVEIEA